MRDKMLVDLSQEVETVSNSLKEKRNLYAELEKTLRTTEREVMVLEGRLAEIKAVVEYIENLSEEETTEDEE